ncbi:MAG: hypothetical protein EBU70_09125 [Actinobacteria bacterium]|nr:hypothetical protein [Actinomycetota bacterium]
MTDHHRTVAGPDAAARIGQHRPTQPDGERRHRTGVVDAPSREDHAASDRCDRGERRRTIGAQFRHRRNGPASGGRCGRERTRNAQQRLAERQVQVHRARYRTE